MNGIRTSHVFRDLFLGVLRIGTIRVAVGCDPVARCSRHQGFTIERFSSARSAIAFRRLIPRRRRGSDQDLLDGTASISPIGKRPACPARQPDRPLRHGRKASPSNAYRGRSSKPPVIERAHLQLAMFGNRETDSLDENGHQNADLKRQ